MVIVFYFIVSTLFSEKKIPRFDFPNDEEEA
jgi:hypothetical protein